MSDIDSEKERQRLADYYSGLLDGELEKIAADRASLTEPAWYALQAELNRRNIQSPAGEAVRNIGVLEFQKQVAVRTFTNLQSALVAKGMLDSAGLDCYLTDANMAQMTGFIPGLGVGIRLMVKEEDAETASQFLDAPPIESEQE